MLLYVCTNIFRQFLLIRMEMRHSHHCQIHTHPACFLGRVKLSLYISIELSLRINLYFASINGVEGPDTSYGDHNQQRPVQPRYPPPASVNQTRPIYPNLNIHGYNPNVNNNNNNNHNHHDNNGNMAIGHFANVNPPNHTTNYRPPCKKSLDLFLIIIQILYFHSSVL